MGERWKFGFLAAAAVVLARPETLAAQTAFQDHSSEIYGIRLSHSPFKVDITHPASAPRLHQIFAQRVTGPVSTQNLSIATPTRIGGWEVTVAFDPTECRILCAYRRTSDGLSMRLPPPATTIRVYSGDQSTTFVVDPAGLGQPAANSRAVAPHEACCIVGQRLYTSPLSAKTDSVASGPKQDRAIPASFNLEATTSAALPLRI